MKTIESTQLNEEPTLFAEETDRLDIYDGLTTPMSDDVILLHSRHRQEIEAFALKALSAYAPNNAEPEPTMVQQKFAVPALVTRVDCTILNGHVVCYELEDSPSGIGIADLLSLRYIDISIKERVLDHYTQLLGDRPFLVVSGSRTHGTDDILVYGKEKYHFQQGDHTLPDNLKDEPVIVKAIPGRPDSHLPYLGLADRAVAPLKTEGDKTYAERLGILERVHSPDELLHDDAGQLSSQVLKARIGSMALGVSIYLSAEDRAKYGKAGSITASRLVRELTDYVKHDGFAYTHRFKPAIQVTNPERRNNLILRMFVLAHPDSSNLKTEVIGGCYVARSEPIVHGATNSVVGSVLVK
jgi:hypothetical protein